MWKWLSVQKRDPADQLKSAGLHPLKKPLKYIRGRGKVIWTQLWS